MKRQAACLQSAALATALFLAPQFALANHPVLVEGELDFDGDGAVGLAEDNDGDLVFGTITRALGAAPAIGQNGTVVIVTSGRFPEVVSITNQVTLEAAPGVDVQIDAFLVPADPRLNEFPAAQADPFALQNAPGIIIDSPKDRYVIIRNVGVVNWTDGIQIRGDSQVLLDNVRSEHNINNGVSVLGNAKVAIKNSSIAATGFRLNPMTGNFPTANLPMPGIGVNFQEKSRGEIRDSSITGNFLAGVRDAPGARVRVRDSLVFGNNRVRQLGFPEAPAPMDDGVMMDDPDMMTDDDDVMMDDAPPADVPADPPVEEVPVDEAPIDPPVTDAPVDDVPVDDAPADDAPVGDAPVDDGALGSDPTDDATDDDDL